MKGKFIMTCMWTELLGTLIENKVDNIQIQCENKSEEKPDEYGKAYCSIHRKIVNEINKSRHKNCINKEKLINRILDYETLFITNIQSLNPLGFIIKLRYEIEDGEFDNG